jgi:hypothetical protein
LKTNILPFPHILEKLTQLQPVHFDWTLRTQLTEKSQELAELQQQVALVKAQLAQLERKRYQGAKKRPAKRLKTPVTKP